MSTYLPKSIFLAPAGTDLGVKLLTLHVYLRLAYRPSAAAVLEAATAAAEAAIVATVAAVAVAGG